MSEIPSYFAEFQARHMCAREGGEALDVAMASRDPDHPAHSSWHVVVKEGDCRYNLNGTRCLSPVSVRNGATDAPCCMADIVSDRRLRSENK